MGFVVGIDLGGTKTLGGIATIDGSIVAEHTVATTQAAGQLPAQLISLIEALASRAGIDREAVAATGIGGAGVPDQHSGGFSMAPNLMLSGDRPLHDELTRALGHPIVLENDVNVAALGELHEGVGRVAADFVFISIGTGVGMGIVADGRLLRGAHGAAGEIGYLPVGTDPLDPAHQRRGPLEEQLAGDALVARYRAASGAALTAPDIFSRAVQGDPHASAAIDEHARWVATAIVAVNAVLDPGIVVLGGGVGARPELLGPVRTWLAALGASSVDVRISELGSQAPVIGAVHLALDAVRLDPKGSSL
ncbi:MAG: ROK family protein [Microbacterium sp.]